MSCRVRRVLLLLAAVVGLAGSAACSNTPTGPSPISGAPQPPGPAPESPQSGAPVVFVGAGDIAVCGSDGAEQTARLLDRIPGLVFTTGDNAYYQGTAQQFRDCYGPTWGRHRDRTYPVAGNHEYETAGAAPYFDYFGAQAGPRGLGYHSYRAGDWDVFALNSNVPAGPGSPQYQWLESALARSTARCSLAIFHHPIVSEGRSPGHDQMRDAWRLLAAHGVELALTGHDHNYQRFVPLDTNLRPDDDRGVRQFVVGTGGAPVYEFTRSTGLVEARGTSLGVLQLTLSADRYAWQFVPVAGSTFADAGQDTCH